ncbi:MAG: PfkB family carbohydrate kinase [Candidatus Thorarchaeota archaeon]
MSLEVLSIGKVNIDVVLRVEDLARTDQHLFSHEGYISFGGSAANFATQSAKLGVKTGLFCCIGSDLYGKMVLRELSRVGVDTRHVLVLENQDTGIFVHISDKKSCELIVVEPGANRFLEKRALDESGMENVRTIHVAGAFPNMALMAAQFATVNGIVFSLDPGRAAASLDYGRLLQCTDILFVNEKELHDYFGLSVVESDLKNFAKTFPGVLVVKRGGHGAVATDGFEYYYSPAFEVDVVDTVGAGDSFDAAFVATWTRTERIDEALNIANAAAALTVSERGAQEGQPSFQEITRLLAEQGTASEEMVRTLNKKAR